MFSSTILVFALALSAIAAPTPLGKSDALSILGSSNLSKEITSLANVNNGNTNNGNTNNGNTNNGNTNNGNTDNGHKSKTPTTTNSQDGLPTFTNPTAGTVWTAGQVYDVTWTTVSETLQKQTGELVLGYGGGNLDSTNPLAKNVALNLGSVQVTANELAGDRDDYFLTFLVGGSGKEGTFTSAAFTIKGSDTTKDANPKVTEKQSGTKQSGTKQSGTKQSETKQSGAEH